MYSLKLYIVEILHNIKQTSNHIKKSVKSQWWYLFLDLSTAKLYLRE